MHGQQNTKTYIMLPLKPAKINPRIYLWLTVQDSSNKQSKFFAQSEILKRNC